MWKTTDRYVQQKRVKAVEAESKLKQVYIPNYTKPNPALITNNKSMLNGSANNGNEIYASNGGKPCESCIAVSSPQWFAWGPANMNCRLCQTCWNYWKKYGGLKIASRLADSEVDILKKRGNGSEVEEDDRYSHRQNHRCTVKECGKEFKLKAHLMRHLAQSHGIAIRSGSPRPIMKTRSAFYLQTTVTTKLSRKLCRSVIKSKKAARQPSFAISLTAVKAECKLYLINYYCCTDNLIDLILQFNWPSQRLI